MFNIIGNKGNANQNHNDTLLNLYQGGQNLFKIFKKWKITSAGEGVEELKLLYTGSRKIKWCRHCENSGGSSKS